MLQEEEISLPTITKKHFRDLDLALMLAEACDMMDYISTNTLVPPLLIPTLSKLMMFEFPASSIPAIRILSNHIIRINLGWGKVLLFVHTLTCSPKITQLKTQEVQKVCVFFS